LHVFLAQVSGTAIFGGVVVGGLAAIGALWRGALNGGMMRQWKREIDDWRRDTETRVRALEDYRRRAVNREWKRGQS
jgi:hypothetical protein